MAVNLGTKLLFEGYVYLRSRQANGKTYWDCNRLRKKECKARAITVADGETTIVLKGPTESPHEHAPDREEAEAEIVKTRYAVHCVLIYKV